MVDPGSGYCGSTPALSITVTPLDDPSTSTTSPSDDGGGGGRTTPPIGCLSEESVRQASHSFYQDIVDDVILGIVFEVHRGFKLGLTALLEEGEYPLEVDADEVGDVGDAVEVFSSNAAKKPAECVCPNCQRNMAASRFAPHLEKCMGMGRNSSRLASRRIASATREAALLSDEDVDDDDWNGGGGGDKRRRHVKKDKNSPRRKKWKNGAPDAAAAANASAGFPLSTTSSSSAGGAGNSGAGGACETAAAAGGSSVGGGPGGGQDPTASSTTGGTAIEPLAMNERRTILSTMCGVVSEHTGRMCTRSLRCPQHSDVQRKGVRQFMLSQESNSEPPALTSDPTDKEKDIDVDTWEEGDSLASLLTAQTNDIPTPNVETGSPAESTSTSASSTSSRRRDTKSRNKKKSKTDN